MAEHYDVFLSYARADAAQIHRLAENLHNAGLEVFLDDWEILPGDILAHRLNSGILNSRNGILAVTPTALSSPCVQSEYAAMMTRAVEGKQRLILVLLADAEMPPLLAAWVYVDLRRAAGPEYEKELQKLIALLKNEWPRPTPLPGGLPRPPGGSRPGDRETAADEREKKGGEATGFDVFLSHNSKDKPAVRELTEALRARGLKVWLDEWELVPGQPWQEALEEVIETTGASAVLVGKDGLGPWQDAEMRGCLSEFVDRKLPVIPVLLPGAPEAPRLPFFLKRFTWVDLRGGLTEEGLDRLQWGVTGKRPDRSKMPDLPLPPQRSLAQGVAIKEDILSYGGQNKNDIQPGQVFTENLTGIRFLWIPGGRFQMGGSVHFVEQPIHWVRVSPFWLGETPVTNRQYASFLANMGYREPDYWRARRFSAPDQPVVGVSWEDAQEFCSWLSEVSWQLVSLPSEAQWEFAARGTDGREYPWGNKPPDSTLACFGLDREQGRTAASGSYPAGRGPFGTLDLAGNVWEWCRDALDTQTYVNRAKQPDEPIDPIAKSPDDRRALRGGGWRSPAEHLRAAIRNWHPAGYRHGSIGFRVVVVPIPEPRP